MLATILRQTRSPSPLAGRLAIQSLLSLAPSTGGSGPTTVSDAS